ncbi:MAG: hypothetical protein A2563_01260 [Candidatus Magasanikbacteria bacterium RIFOXYD1_FULL_40_23]|uniref:Uncharacterized protein n=1 Tax=Candidatus Magasanikbacteria bacterium RIFOXYD1_FULL_40_23 TaxID=1798705 RepID=A0A1F6PAL1_9BACT|nr:MAG: hypothetical protein A2563_01260 [Candidatus Magasanikbacteria bacterium RIFOXYD1_FULL_40_23]
MSEIQPGHNPEITGENKEKEPNITVDFFFSYHGTPEDFSRLPEALKKADVFIPEEHGWTKYTEKLYNEISEGKTNPDEINFSHVDKKILSLLYNSKKPVLFIDTPSEHPITIEAYTPAETEAEAIKDFLEGYFDLSITNIKSALGDKARNIIEREKIMAATLKEKIKNLTQQFPQLKNKENINILAALGVTHTSLHQQLRPELQQSNKILGRDTIVFTTAREIVRTLIRNPEKIFDDEVYARALIENIVSFLIKDTTLDSNKISWVARKLCANLSMDRIQLFSKNTGHLLLGQQLNTHNIKHLPSELAKIGIKLPTTEEEIDKLLNIRKK